MTNNNKGQGQGNERYHDDQHLIVTNNNKIKR